jgi:hypothetical protein
MAKRGRKPKNIAALAEENVPTVPKKRGRKPKNGENPASPASPVLLEENGVDENLLPVPTQQVDFPYLFTLKVDNTHVFHNQQTSFQLNDIFGLKIENMEKNKDSGDLTLWFSLVRLVL